MFMRAAAVSATHICLTTSRSRRMSGTRVARRHHGIHYPKTTGGLVLFAAAVLRPLSESNRGTTVYDVPLWLREQDVDLRGACYVSADNDAVLLSVVELRGPPDLCGYNSERLLQVLEALATGTPWPAVPVYRAPGDGAAVLLDGAHRLAVAKAIGLAAIPCLLLTREEAELCYR